MTLTTKKKNVFKELLDPTMTEPQTNQQIVKILSSKGNNLHEVELPDNSKFLVSMPSKFRRNVWIKNGDFVLIDPIDEGNKVKGEICEVLTKDYIKFLKSCNCWPEGFIIKNNNLYKNEPVHDTHESSTSDSESESD